MTPEEVGAFLDQGRRLHAATIGPNASPHLTTLWYVMEGGKLANNAVVLGEPERTVSWDHGKLGRAY